MKPPRFTSLMLIVVFALTGAISSARASCGTQYATNPDTGNQEKVWAEHDGHDYEIKWAEKVNGQWQGEIFLTNNSTDDTCPHLAHDTAGSTGVVWREGNGSIYYIGRKDVSGTWTWQSAGSLVLRLA